MDNPSSRQTVAGFGPGLGLFFGDDRHLGGRHDGHHDLAYKTSWPTKRHETTLQYTFQAERRHAGAISSCLTC
jgi:hypothetical protein